MKPTSTILSVSTLVALATAATQASIVIAEFNGASPARSVTVVSGDPATSGTYSAGRMNWTQHAPLNPILGTTFTAFCIEITQNIGNGDIVTYDTAALEDAPQPANSVAPMGVQRAELIAELFGRYFPIVLGDTSTMIMPIAGSFSASERNAAFQIAIWELVYETDALLGPVGVDLDLTGGNISFNEDGGVGTLSNDTEILAQAFLDGLTGDGPRAGLFALVSQTRQDMIVPAPGCLAMLGLGGLLAARRRR